MSRQAIITQLVTGSKLYLHKSLNFESLGIPQDETARTLYISSEVSAAISFPFPDTPEGGALANSERGSIILSRVRSSLLLRTPIENRPTRCLRGFIPVKNEFWSIRVTLPETTPGIRSLGAFSDTDEFVALTWEKRETINNQFDQEVERVTQVWKDFFGIVPPHQGNNINDYLTICDSV
jgi:hypothetical protein